MPRAGTFIPTSTVGELVKAFHPAPLPPSPPLELSNSDLDLMDRARGALGRLDGIATLLPDPALFIYYYVRKEAVLSSQIEGTQSSLSDLLLYESEEIVGVPLDDVREVSSYVAAMTYGLQRLREGFPLSLRLLREIHGHLLASGRGSNCSPGEFRTTQNWIGGSRPGNAQFVPPPPHLIMECMGALERFLHDDPIRLPILIKAGLAHVQFETIHPFLDGNGRVGRLLITLLFCAESVLTQPVLYLSLYFKQHRQTYYQLLQRVREEGAWEEWLRFFFRGVLETSDQAVRTAQQTVRLFDDHRQRIESAGRAVGTTLRVHTHLQRRPFASITEAARALGLSIPTVSKTFEQLGQLGILRELTGRQRSRLFVYHPYMQLLQEGTERPESAPST